jgi:hypothetical protein
MIELPRRSVTRFFIPLIDVLTLLFCIFLLMPMVKPAEGSATDLEKLRQLQAELERLRQQGQVLTPEKEAEMQRLQREREEKTKALEQRLLVRVLEIDPGTGKLYINDPERIEVRNQADARELIDRDSRTQAAQGPDRRDLYYLILYPRTRNSPYPLREQREQYDSWFADVAHGWDVPGASTARGGEQP